MSTRPQLTSTPITEELLRGALELERTAHGLLPHRLPARARAQNTDGQLAMAEAQPSGVRIVLRTRATLVELDTLPTKRVYVGAPPRPDGVYDLLVDGRLAGRTGVSGGNTLMIDMAAGTAESRPGPVGTVRFSGLSAEVKDVEIWLPHNETTELVALRTDAPVEPVTAPDRAVWLHHGSSISHGSDAAGPTATWPALAAALGGVELVNLGFAGSALLDPFTARTLRDAPADLISVKAGINLVNTDVMRLRAFTPAVHGFLDTVREGHPTTPLLVVSPILCPIHETTPGPSAPDHRALSEGRLSFSAAGDPAETAAGKLTLSTIRDELARIVAQRAADDPNLHYLDGRELYGEADSVELPLPDALHPDAATHRRMGERFARLAFRPGGPLAVADDRADRL
ncbi:MULTISPECIES: GDSL-type esterase/lipase family protein [Streptomyces]|uniref:SGNH/GDSL hydrolase family protein n=1 Tax=Streptomyces glycanivorans TaxID=3033808 RepID=A0ABY9JKP6_9ACTN|nr:MULTISPECIES: GDSL-type esterase/lipase family protein [unclassified Streptomyces]TXS13103.1 lipase [Streptomyces sp. wa22]WLQ68301.1 SGNH/GDSL hydrolase family protein [Streptomyces sp. Alt3]WSQ88983.1 GDSL-type esterase/lipase family protein [Streptomyces sp. NBC_01212]WSR05011.1 GDSL-type esterase/lipase family protein [Streptomyces sp. NBC_01208]WSR52378.1 GDSL-type esterase/lipase family protein [Streptomyces sp. NBC_01201]